MAESAKRSRSAVPLTSKLLFSAIEIPLAMGAGYATVVVFLTVACSPYAYERQCETGGGIAFMIFGLVAGCLVFSAVLVIGQLLRNSPARRRAFDLTITVAVLLSIPLILVS